MMVQFVVGGGIECVVGAIGLCSLLGGIFQDSLHGCVIIVFRVGSAFHLPPNPEQGSQYLVAANGPHVHVLRLVIKQVVDILLQFEGDLLQVLLISQKQGIHLLVGFARFLQNLVANFGSQILFIFKVVFFHDLRGVLFPQLGIAHSAGLEPAIFAKLAPAIKERSRHAGGNLAAFASILFGGHASAVRQGSQVFAAGPFAMVEFQQCAR
mmetsp:Transcript_35601/g.74099  ORF Transcript_35601/g.74099 Transcript_35601/m.74099 type:complete len:210 (-) Transcript_35601:802-1431(-)